MIVKRAAGDGGLKLMSLAMDNVLGCQVTGTCQQTLRGVQKGLPPGHETLLRCIGE